MTTWQVAALYHFAELADPAARQGPLMALCRERGIKGTLLLTEEGVNGTIAGSAEGIAEVVAHIESWPEIDGLDVKYSTSSQRGFLRMKVRLKKEIVTMGKPGAFVAPEDWNDLIRRGDVMVVDTRNSYETRIGTFEGAVDPNTGSFRAFPGWAGTLAAKPDRPTAVAMYTSSRNCWAIAA